MSVLQFHCWWCRLSRITVGVSRLQVQYGTSSNSSLAFHYVFGSGSDMYVWSKSLFFSRGTKQQHSLAQHKNGTRGTRCPVQQVNYAKSTKRRPNPRTDTDVTEGVVDDSTASAAKSNKRVTTNSDVSAPSAHEDSQHDERAGARRTRGRIARDGHGDHRLVGERGHHPGGGMPTSPPSRRRRWGQQ